DERPQLLRRRRELAPVEERGESGVLHDRRQLARRQASPERHGDEARLPRREESVEELGAVVRQDPEAVALREPERLDEDAPPAGGTCVELAVREPLARL